LKDKSWQTWTDFEKDLEEFELKMSTAYYSRLDKSDLMKLRTTKAAYGASCHSGGSKEHTRAIYSVSQKNPPPEWS